MKNTQERNDWTPPIGAKYLAPSGRTWTVRSITPRGSRAVITCDAPDGEHGAVVDFTAISRMIALDADPTTRPDGSTSQRPVTVPTTASADIRSDTADAHA
jgi:hypothetical protein